MSTLSSISQLVAKRVKGRLDGARSRAQRLYDMSRCHSFVPKGRARGSALLSYVPFGNTLEGPLPGTHSEFAESREIARAFLNRGYAVDVISFQNDVFLPRKTYNFFVDTRRNLQRLAPLLGDSCVKIMHINAAHVLYHNAAQLRRLLDVQGRRGVTLRLRKFEMPYWAIENADCATVLGNDFTMGTYQFAGKPLYPVPVTSVALFPAPKAKDYEACRRRFLWLGSDGMVHKGLDLLLEAFAGLPGYELTVCGPVEEERDFVRAYRRELFETPNIRTTGWIDVQGLPFREVAANHLSLVYPSCSEGQCGAVITCMHAGLIPIISYQSGVDVEDHYGVVLRECTVQEIRQRVCELAETPAHALKEMALRTWEYARSHHTLENFAASYGAALDEIIARFCPVDAVCSPFQSTAYR
jgi:glycosyltransferase involved in cell wall biosynthesis